MDSILAFFRAAKSPMGRLARIEGLVVMAAAILLLMSILESYRRRSRSSILKLLLLILDTVSASMVTYTIGLIQAVPFENDLLQVWAVLLTTLKESIDYISAYGVVDQIQERRRRELRDLMESFWAAYLNATRGTMFKYPLWLLWGLNFSKILHRIISFGSATQSYGIGKNSMLVADYMKYEHELSDQDQVDPALMSGYKYLVLGEDKQKVEPEIPSYLMKLKITHEKRLITLDKIWRCNGRLLSAKGGDADGQLKDLCLSFAMCKLLRRRFDDLHLLQESDHPKHRDLVLKGLIAEHGDFKRPFRVIEVELAFLSDFFYSRYPVIFSKGFPVFNIVLVLMVGATCWLAVAILAHFKYPAGDLHHIEHGVDVGKIITLLLLIVIVVKELWEIITYIFSDWAKVVLLCKYVEKPSWQKFVCVDKVLGFLCRHRVTKPWHRKIGQFSLLSSFDYKPWNLGYKLTWGLVNKRAQGAKSYNPIRLPDAVKIAIRDSLISNCGQLSNGKSSLEKNEVIREISWALRHETNAHCIMVWHIATSLCEIELLQKCKANIESPGRLEKYLKKIRSCATHIKNWWRRPPFFVNLEILQGDLRFHYEIAASLSRYCTYLVVFKQGLVSDKCAAAEFIFPNTILEAREFFGSHSSMKSWHEKMIMVEESPETIIAKGMKLGKQLIDTIQSDEIRWKVLADFWAEWILFIAPSHNTKAHEAALAKGGEFMTHLWALLSHAGILGQQSEAPDSSI